MSLDIYRHMLTMEVQSLMMMMMMMLMGVKHQNMCDWCIFLRRRKGVCKFLGFCCGADKFFILLGCCATLVNFRTMYCSNL
jgi:hypothetical protein